MPPNPASALRAHPRTTAAVVAVLAVAGVALVVGVLAGGGAGPPGAAPPASTAEPESLASSSPRVDTTREATYAQMRVGYPDRLVVPVLDVDAPVLAVKAPGRTLIPPADARRLGWWADGARPGSPTGSALIAGHTVHTGGGALDDLETLRRGDAVYVQNRLRRDGKRVQRTVAYVVQSVEIFRKGTIARRAEELFSQRVDGRLVLLTCEDWNGTRYLSNVVVTAKPANGQDGWAGADTAARAVSAGRSHAGSPAPRS